VFFNPNFPHDTRILAIRLHLRQKLAYLCLHGFSGLFGPKWQFWGQNRGRGGALLTLNEFVLILGVVTYVPLLAKINQEMQP